MVFSSSSILFVRWRCNWRRKGRSYDLTSRNPALLTVSDWTRRGRPVRWPRGSTRVCSALGIEGSLRARNVSNMVPFDVSRFDDSYWIPLTRWIAPFTWIPPPVDPSFSPVLHHYLPSFWWKDMSCEAAVSSGSFDSNVRRLSVLLPQPWPRLCLTLRLFCLPCRWWR